MFILQDILGLKWLIQFKDYKYSFNLKNIQFQNKDNKISELKHLSIPEQRFSESGIENL